MNNISTKVRKQIDNYFVNNWTSTEIQTENRILDSADLKEYIAPYLLPVEAIQQTLGTSAGIGERRDYILVVQIFVGKGGGTRRLDTLADTLESLFSRISIQIAGEDAWLEFGVVLPPVITNSMRAGWFQGNIRIPFYLQN